MKKPASELIALADNHLPDWNDLPGECRNELVKAASWHAEEWNAGQCALDIYNKLRETLPAQKFPLFDRTAANQSGSERAGVDALREALTNARQKLQLYRAEHCGIYIGGVEYTQLVKQIDAALATPPAPAATHGKPDGAVQPFDWRASEHTEGPNDCGHFTAGIDIPEPDICGRPGFHYCAIEFHSKDKAIAEARRNATLAALHSPKIAAAETCAKHPWTGKNDPEIYKRAWDAFVEASCKSDKATIECIKSVVDTALASSRPNITEDRLREALANVCDRLQHFLDTFGDLGDCVTQADIDDWIELTTSSDGGVVADTPSNETATDVMAHPSPMGSRSCDVKTTACGVAGVAPGPSKASPGDVLAMKDACKRAVAEVVGARDDLGSVHYTEIAAAIDRLDVKAEAKSQEPDAVAWQYRDCWKDHWSTCNERPAELKGRTVRPLFTHPTTKPEAPAVSVDAISNAVLVAWMNDERWMSPMGHLPAFWAEIAAKTAVAALTGER